MINHEPHYCVHASLSAAAWNLHRWDVQHTNDSTTTIPMDAEAHIQGASGADDTELISFFDVRRSSPSDETLVRSSVAVGIPVGTAVGSSSVLGDSE
jgi:hypothetical protein